MSYNNSNNWICTSLKFVAKRSKANCIAKSIKQHELADMDTHNDQSNATLGNAQPHHTGKQHNILLAGTASHIM